MKRTNPASSSRDIGPSIRQTADLRRLCLSLHEAKHREAELALAAEFEQVISRGGISIDPQTLLAGLRELWRRGQHDRIIAVTSWLPADILQSNETALMYHLCALKRRAEQVPTAGSHA